MRTTWNDDEDDAMQGLSCEAQVMYLRGIRRFMDYDTGIAGGPRRKLSLQSLAEVIDVQPAWGSTRRRQPVTKAKVRALLTELKRTGLIEDHGSSRERGLVLNCLLADTGLLRPKKERHRNDTEQQHKEQRRNDTVKNEEKQNIKQDDEDRSSTGSNIAKLPRNDTHPVSGNTLPNLCAQARADEEPDDARPEVPMAWATWFMDVRGFQLHIVQTPSTIPLFKHWCDLGVTVGQMRQAMAAAEAKLGRVPDRPNYYKPFLEQLLTETERLEHTSTGGLNDATGKSRSCVGSSRSDIDRQLQDPGYALSKF